MTTTLRSLISNLLTSKKSKKSKESLIRSDYNPIFKIIKITENKYCLNDNIIIKNIDFDPISTQITYDLDIDELNITEQEATKIANYFVGNALQ